MNRGHVLNLQFSLPCELGTSLIIKKGKQLTSMTVKKAYYLHPKHDFLNGPNLEKPSNLKIRTTPGCSYTYIRYACTKYYNRRNLNIMAISCKGNFFTIKEPVLKQLDLSIFKEVPFTSKDAARHFILKKGVGQNDCCHFYEYDQNQIDDLIDLINQITNLV